MSSQHRFQFGIEAEFALADRDSFEPLWHPDLKFEDLNALLESIPTHDIGDRGLRLETPHRKLMPYVVEGYHLPDPDMNPVDLLPKGVEIRTPICDSVDECVTSLTELCKRLQAALAQANYTAVAISFHPLQHSFHGPQNKRREDFWHWAMEAMLTYGPDINIHLPSDFLNGLDVEDLDAKVNYYGPAVTALSLASPIYRGGLWTIRGRVGKSVRTYHRSVIAPAIEIHLDQEARLEFKLFDTPSNINDFRGLVLLWLVLLLNSSLSGRATRETRVYDLGAVARFGLDSETVCDRAAEVLNCAPSVLDAYGFNPAPLAVFRKRLESRHVPADDIVELYRREQSVPGVLRYLTPKA